MNNFIIQAPLYFFLWRFDPIWVSKKRKDKESTISLTPKPSHNFFVYPIQIKEINFTEKEFLRKRKSAGLNDKQREAFLPALATAIKKDSTTSLIRKHANEFKVYEKTMRTAIKQDLSQALTPLLKLYGEF